MTLPTDGRLTSWIASVVPGAGTSIGAVTGHIPWWVVVLMMLLGLGYRVFDRWLQHRETQDIWRSKGTPAVIRSKAMATKALRGDPPTDRSSTRKAA